MASVTGETAAHHSRARDGGQTDCRSCGALLPKGAHYCTECGTSADLVAIDLFHVEEAALPPEAERPNGRRRGLWILVAIVIAAAAALWAITITADIDEDESASPQLPADESVVGPSDSDASPMTTSAPTTTPAGPSTTVKSYVNDTAGAVLGADVDGTVVLISGRTMRHIDLATGEITRIGLEHSPAWGWYGPDGSVTVDGKHIAYNDGRLIITDLRDGSQPEPPTLGDGSDGEPLRVAGRAGLDSVWLVDEPWDDGVSAAIEVGLDGEIRRRIDLPAPFHIRSADGDDLMLDSPAGSWRYDPSTGSAEPMPAGVVFFEPTLTIIMSCDDTLDCEVQADTGDGPDVVDWLNPEEMINGELRLSPTGDSLLLLSGDFGWDGPPSFELSYIGLDSGVRRDLGPVDVNPWEGITWIGDTPWIVGFEENQGRRLRAIDTVTGDQIPIELDRWFDQPTLLTYLPPPAADWPMTEADVSDVPVVRLQIDAVVRVIDEEGGFGPETGPFDEIIVASTIGGDSSRPVDPGVIGLLGDGGRSARFTNVPDAEIAYLESVGTTDVAVVFIDDLRFYREHAEIDLRLWCGDTCDATVTYEAEMGPERFVITGVAATEGGEQGTAVFTWGDDLTEWVTGDEMADAIAGMLPGVTGEDLEGGAQEHHEGDTWGWEFRVPGEAGVWAINVHPHDDLLRSMTDPRLPPEVIYGPDWGGYMLSGPHSDEVIGIIVGQPSGSSLSEEERVFAVASMMLPEMGWAD